MTMYIAAYDTESPDCLAGVRRIVEVHEAFEMPATFFLVANLLDKQEAEYKALLRDHPLFEIACHTYSHMPLVATPRYGLAGPPERSRGNSSNSKQRIEDLFGREVIGCARGLAPSRLTTVPPVSARSTTRENQYVSSMAWGPAFLSARAARPTVHLCRPRLPRPVGCCPPCGWTKTSSKETTTSAAVLLCLSRPTCLKNPRDY